MIDRFRIRMNITYRFLLNISDINYQNIIYKIIERYMNGSYSFFMDQMISDILIKIYNQNENIIILLKYFFDEFCKKQVNLCNIVTKNMYNDVLYTNIKSYIDNCISMKYAIIDILIEDNLIDIDENDNLSKMFYNIIKNNFYSDEREKICNVCINEAIENDKLKEYFYVIS